MSILGGTTPAAQIFSETEQQLAVLELVHRPGKEVMETLLRLRQTGDEDLLGAPPVDGQMATAVRAGLLVRAGFFDEAHEACQNLPTPEGSYWHGILHRLEPEESNAKYWFHRVGHHPLFTELPGDEASAELAEPPLDAITSSGTWDPFAFVDQCTLCIRGRGPDLRRSLERLQAAEIRALLQYCYRGAIAG